MRRVGSIFALVFIISISAIFIADVLNDSNSHINVRNFAGRSVDLGMDSVNELAETPIIQNPLEHRGTDATYYQIADDNSRAQIFTDIHDANLNTLFMDIKLEDGTLGYSSQNPTANQIGAIIDWTGESPLQKALQKPADVNLGMRFVVGQDAKYAAAFPEQSISSQWVDIGCTDYQNYLAYLVKEITASGVDEINLDFLRYPDTYDVENPVLPCSAGKSKAQIIDELAAKLADAAKSVNSNIIISASVFGRICYDANIENGDPVIGQRITIADHVDYLSPMLYPEQMESYYHDKPCEGVKDYTECFRKVISKEKVKPGFRVLANSQPRRIFLTRYRELLTVMEADTLSGGWSAFRHIVLSGQN